MLENISFHHHTQPLFEKYNVLPVTTIFDYRLCKVYKQQVKMVRSFLKHPAKLKPNDIVYNTRHIEHWSVLTYRTSYGQQMVENRLPIMLNTFLSRIIALEGITFRNLRNFFISFSECCLVVYFDVCLIFFSLCRGSSHFMLGESPKPQIYVFPLCLMLFLLQSSSPHFLWSFSPCHYILVIFYCILMTFML